MAVLAVEEDDFRPGARAIDERKTTARGILHRLERVRSCRAVAVSVYRVPPQPTLPVTNPYDNRVSPACVGAFEGSQSAFQRKAWKDRERVFAEGSGGDHEGEQGKDALTVSAVAEAGYPETQFAVVENRGREIARASAVSNYPRSQKVRVDHQSHAIQLGAKTRAHQRFGRPVVHSTNLKVPHCFQWNDPLAFEYAAKKQSLNEAPHITSRAQDAAGPCDSWFKINRRGASISEVSTGNATGWSQVSGPLAAGLHAERFKNGLPDEVRKRHAGSGS